MIHFSKNMKKFRFLSFPKPKTEIKAVFTGEEIALKDLVNLFFERKHILLIFVTLTLIVGIISVTTTEDIYLASTVIVPEGSGPEDPSKKKIKGIASLAGVGNLGASGGSNLTSPNFYPEIVQNELFLLPLLEEKFRFSEYKKRLSLLEYFNNHEFDDAVTVWRKSLIKGTIPFFDEEFEKSDKTGYGQQKYKGDTTITNIIEVSGQQKKAMARLRNAILVEQDQENGLISISVTLPESRVSAEVANLVMERMIDFAVDHKTRKEKRKLEFVRNREQLARRNFEQAQYEFAEFIDQNQNVISARVLSREEQLRTELKIITSIYSQLATELESAQITLQEQTPVYSIFTPVIVPKNPEKATHFVTLLIHVFTGIFLGFAFIVLIIVRGLLK